MNPYNLDEIKELSDSRIRSALDFVERQRLVREMRGDEQPTNGSFHPVALAGAVAVLTVIAWISGAGPVH